MVVGWRGAGDWLGCVDQLERAVLDFEADPQARTQQLLERAQQHQHRYCHLCKHLQQHISMIIVGTTITFNIVNIAIAEVVLV